MKTFKGVVFENMNRAKGMNNIRIVLSFLKNKAKIDAGLFIDD